MFRLARLYSEPNVFEPIFFRPGLNLILGETKESNQKTNGVGKSLAIDFLSFALLKKLKDCRISQIPTEAFDPRTKICLDFTFFHEVYTIKRSVESHANPELVYNGHTTTFATLEDATEFFTNKFIPNSGSDLSPSFRSLLGPLIRDEKSEFKSLVLCFDTNKRIPPDYTPHLFLLNVDFEPYRAIKSIWVELNEIRIATTKIKDNIEELTGKNLQEAKAELNELSNQVTKIQSEIDELENLQGFDYIQDEIVGLEVSIETARARQSVLKHEISKIKLFSGNNYIPDKEVEELYNQFSSGLGNFIKKQLEEVVEFKNRIENFQKSLLGDRRNSIIVELSELEKNIADLDRQYRERLSLLNQNGSLKNLKQSVAIQQKKMEELASLSSWMKAYTKYELEKTVANSEKNRRILELKFSLREASGVIESVQESILKAHEYIAGNRHCSFEVEVANTKEIIKFNLRIHDDGSHSNEREKVFMYDVSLLLNQDVSTRHLGFLVHDNIFDVDQDTLVKSLNFLADSRELLNAKQYILTINEDKFREEDFKTLKLKLNDFAVARYTKSCKFLNVNYQERGAKK